MKYTALLIAFYICSIHGFAQQPPIRHDFTVKYAGTAGNGDNYFISLYDGRDQFSYSLDHENIKYSNVIRVPGPQSGSISIHAEAVPFTPTLYLNMSF